MKSPRFFSPDPLPRAFIPGVRLAVGEEMARHWRVLRLAEGDAVTLFDGLGGEYQAAIAMLGKREADATLLAFEPIERESPLSITLVQALAASDKMDLIVQKAVELGVAAIQPVATERATLKLTGERAEKRAAHWQAVARAACEQCGRNRVPPVAELTTLDAWLTVAATGPRFLLQPDAEKPLVSATSGAGSIALLVGPEGGFSDREIAAATQHGVLPVRFGPRTLRTETAGLAALAALNAVAGDLK